MHAPEDGRPILIIKESKESKYWRYGGIAFMIVLCCIIYFLAGIRECIFFACFGLFAFTMHISRLRRTRYTEINAFETHFTAQKKSLPDKDLKLLYTDILELDATFKYSYKGRRGDNVYLLNFTLNNESNEEKILTIRHDFPQRELRPFFDILESHDIPISITDTTFDTPI